jgi:hypothetical protein
MADNLSPARARTFGWGLVLYLVGLDYFSTLAYLPSIAVGAAGALAPLAAAGVVAVTLLGAVPVYLYVVGRSPDGHGATGLLERHLRGWTGKLIILVLLGFVATDFVITRTLSVADASIHVLHNPYWKSWIDWLTQNKEQVRASFPGPLRGAFFDFWNEQIGLSVVLAVLCFGFWAFLVRSLSRGFLRLAALVVGLYLLLTALVVGSCLVHLADHPQVVQEWWAQLPQEPNLRPDLLRRSLAGAVVLLALLSFPQMALGVSGFELSMTSAPLVSGRPDDDPAHPRGRIRNTRKLLVAAALVMGVFILGSVFSVTLLVPPDQLRGEGALAAHRALAYIAHGHELSTRAHADSVNPLFGEWFGSLYDLSTVLILCLAGASATLGVRDLVPHYLARFGMQLAWAHKVNVILHLFNVTILVVILLFRASVSAQQWAYATSVLVLLTAASFAAVLDVRARWQGSWRRWLAGPPFYLIALFFLCEAALTAGVNATGLAIAAAFVVTLLATAFVSRWLRSTEPRFEGFSFADERSKSRWEEICRLEFQVLVPHRPGSLPLREKDRVIRRRHRLGPEVPILFVEAEKGDPSDFFNTPLLRVAEEDGFEIIRVSRVASVAHVLAAIALAFRHVGHPPEIHFAWSDESPLAANLHFLFLGEGNVPWMVRELIRKAEPDPARQPRVVIG